MKLNFGVIGVGEMGKNHVRVYHELGVLKAISDIDKEKGKPHARKFGCEYYKDYIEMIEEEDLDGVSVCVPTFQHHEVSMDLLEKGINLLVEKPISDELKKAKEMIRVSRKNKAILMIGHIERFNPTVRKIKELKNELGKILSITTKRVGPFPHRVKDASVLIDLAVHDIDVMLYLCGADVMDVKFFGENYFDDRRCDYATALLKFSDGTIGNIETSWITPVKVRKINVLGKKGSCEGDYILQTLKFWDTFVSREYDDFSDLVLKFSGGDAKEVYIEKEEPLKLELEHFIDCIKNGREPEVNGESGMKVLEVIEKMKDKEEG